MMKKLFTGAWYPIDLAHIDQRHIDEIAESGVDLIFAAWGSVEEKKEILRMCSSAGVQALVEDPRVKEASSAAEMAAAIDEYRHEPSFAGNMFADEPGANAYPALGEQVRQYAEAAPGKIAYINLLPNYAPLAACCTDSYEAYVEKFAEQIDTDYISVDIYPLSWGDGIKYTSTIYFRNLEQLAAVCRKTGRQFWGFIQTMGFNTVMREPTEAEMRWQCYAYLAFGANGIFHFCYATPPSGGELFERAMLDKQAEKTNLWYAAKAVNDELHALSPIYSPFCWLGARSLFGAGKERAGLEFDHPCTDAVCPSIRSLRADESALAGYFTRNGRDALILLNTTEIRDNTPCTVTLTCSARRITLYRRGLPTVITSENGVFAIRLDSCEGVFVTID